jgi:hypothetical protein
MAHPPVLHMNTQVLGGYEETGGINTEMYSFHGTKETKTSGWTIRCLDCPPGNLYYELDYTESFSFLYGTPATVCTVRINVHIFGKIDGYDTGEEVESNARVRRRMGSFLRMFRNMKLEEEERRIEELLRANPGMSWNAVPLNGIFEATVAGKPLLLEWSVGSMYS